MLDKELFRLAKGSGKYIVATVLMSLAAMMLNVAITACICTIIALASRGAEGKE